MTDTRPFHVSFLRTIDTYNNPPMRITDAERVLFPFGRPGPAPSAPMFNYSATNRGWPKPEKWPNLLHNLRHDEADIIFARSPVYGSVFGYILSDATAAVLQQFNLGRSELVWLDPPSDADLNVFRGAWTLWPAERYPTLFVPQWIYGEDPPFSEKINAFSYNPNNVSVAGGQYRLSWYDKDTRTYLLPCRQPDTNVDLWVDPLWPQSLFLTNRLVEALDTEGLLMGTKDGWRTRPCRAPLPEETTEDQVQPWIRAITDREWETMDEKTFRHLWAKAGSEAGGRAALTFIQTLNTPNTHLCMANVLLSHYDEQDMKTVFTQDTVTANLVLRQKTITWMEAASDDLQLYIFQLAIPVTHPKIQDLTHNLEMENLPIHNAHIKIAWKTSNPAAYTDAVLKSLTQNLIDAATREYDTVGVHWG